MKSILAFAIIGAVMYVCGIGEKQSSEAPPTNAAAPVKSKPDKDAVKAELVKIEEEMTQAALNGDITLLARNTTDDFKLTGVDGKVQDKNEALADVKKEKNIKSWSITDADLMSFSDDSAVLSYTQNVTLNRPVRRSLDDKIRTADDDTEMIEGQQPTGAQAPSPATPVPPA